MTRLLPLSLLLFAACGTTSSRTSFRQAAAVQVAPAPQPAPSFPTPGFTPAGAGASHGMLATPAPEVPRSPNKRVLPASDEPGIWAADHPVNVPPGRRRVFDIEIPSGATIEDKTVTAECSGGLADVMKRSPYWDTFIAETPEAVRRCMAAKAFLFCAEGLSAQLKAGRLPHPTFGPDAIEPTAKRAAMMERAFCAGIELDGKQKATLEGVQRRWQSQELSARLRPPRNDP